METKTSFDMPLLPDVDTRPLLLARIRKENRKRAQGVPTLIGKEDFLTETKEELGRLMLKMRTFQLETIGRIYSDISTMEELDELEKNGELPNMLCRGRNRACIILRLKKEKKNLGIVNQVLKEWDCQVMEIKNNSKGFLKKNGFSEGTDGQAVE